MSDANTKKTNKNTKQNTKNNETKIRRKTTKSAYKKDVLNADFISVEEMCNKFDGKFYKIKF